jgi:hypothetical protein
LPATKEVSPISYKYKIPSVIEVSILWNARKIIVLNSIFHNAIFPEPAEAVAIK